MEENCSFEKCETIVKKLQKWKHEGIEKGIYSPSRCYRHILKKKRL